VRADKRRKLEAAGWKVGSAAEFLELSPEEEALIEVKLCLSKTLKIVRERSKISQQRLAEKLGSSQSRVAKMEAGDSSVTMDLLVKAILATGNGTAVVAKVIAALNTAAPKDRAPSKKATAVCLARKNSSVKVALKGRAASRGKASTAVKKNSAPHGKRATV